MIVTVIEQTCRTKNVAVRDLEIHRFKHSTTNLAHKYCLPHQVCENLPGFISLMWGTMKRNHDNR
jgi:hypothetical protein